MELSKGMLNAFALITQGANSLGELAKRMKRSLSWTSEVVSKLEQEEFIQKKRGGTVKKARIEYVVAATSQAITLKEFMFNHPPDTEWEHFFGGSRLHFLVACLYDWSTLDHITQLSGVSKRQISRIIPSFYNRSIILIEKNRYRVNNRGWSDLTAFLKAYASFSHESGKVEWKFKDEILLSVKKEEQVKGTMTGLAVYKDYGVYVGVISALCHLPKKELSKEEIFVHSLFEVDDPRTLHLAMTFYLKNHLSYDKVLPYTFKYGKYTMFTQLVSLFDRKEKIVELPGLPAFDRIDFYRIATMYDVKGLEHPGYYKRRF